MKIQFAQSHVGTSTFLEKAPQDDNEDSINS